MKVTAALIAAMLAALKTQMDGGFLYLYAGTVPATAHEGLGMVATHTEVAKITLNNDGVTGLTFDAPVGKVLSKAAAETWSGTIAFDGAQAAEASLEPTFYRFCQAGDDGRAAVDETVTARLQGTVGGPSSGAECVLQADVVTPGEVQPIGLFRYRGEN